MAFSDEVIKDGSGAVVKLDISLDYFSSIAYRYSTHAGIDSSNDYHPCITSIGTLTRGLGLDHVMQAGMVDLEFANDDELLDWMCERATASDVLKARCRLYVGAYSSATSIQWKQLGEFIFSEFPRRDHGRVRATLADDALGLLDQPVQLPTLRDWVEQDDNALTNPLAIGTPEWLVPDSTQIPLAFGEDAHECFRPGFPAEYLSATFDTAYVDLDFISGATYVVCCTNDTANAGSDDEISEVYVDMGDERPVLLPRTFYAPSLVVFNGTISAGEIELWKPVRSSVITKGGISYRVIFIIIHAMGFYRWRTAAVTALGGNAAYAVHKFFAANEVFNLRGLNRVWAKGSPLSARNATSVAAQTASDVIRDLIQQYSTNGSSRVHADSFDDVKNDVGGLSNTSGQVGFGAGATSVTLRDTISAIAASHDFDVFARWDGTIALTARGLEYDADAIQEIAEEDILAFEDGFASREQRGAPFNRVYLEAREPSPITAEEWPEGPFDSPGGEVSTWGRPFARTLAQSWRAEVLRTLNPWQYRNIEAATRPVARFTTTLAALSLELGDYFRVSWSRNLGVGDPYDRAIFQVDELSVNLEAGTVSVVATWSDDTSTTRAYVLDSETLLTRASGSGGRTATVTDGDATVSFSSGNLVSDGVSVGDHLILKDSAEAATGFARNRAIRIGSVTHGTSLELDSADLDFDAPGGTAVSAWEIRRSHTTYHTASSDPTNYPDGGTAYGRVADVTDSAGVYSGSGPEGLGTEAHKAVA